MTRTYRTDWVDDDRTAIHIEFDGKWQSDDLNEVEHRLHDMLSTVGHSVELEVVIPRPRPIPMPVLDDIRHLLDFQHPNRGKVKVITEPRYLPAFQEIVRRTFGGTLPAHLTLTDTIDD